ncbi:L,D-transpeptidase [Sphingomonas parva]|uniref:L,D-transpeptidase n=2 Tax=Sphingomonas parva TaxID=2555898 RepID=A0A4Y8ZNJ2_9SPHN|nr:L,D-transpeptidase [Sphingomonas parva]
MTLFLAASPAPAPGNHRDAPLRAAAIREAPAPAPAKDPPPGLRLRSTETAPVAPAPPPARPDFTIRSILALDHPLAPGEYAWNEEGAPAGAAVIVADLRAQMLYVYRQGVEIGRTSLIQGDVDKPTPLGIFPILQKKRHHISNLYDAPMPYMLRLTWDGVAIHSSVVSDDYATHGCIGIPDEFAQLLFGQAKLGDHVLVTRGWDANGPGRA